MSGIDDIVEMILKEALSRQGHGLVSRLYVVLREVSDKILTMIDVLKEGERRKREDDQKTH